VRRSCTDWSESREETDRRIDAMLRELVVEEGIKCREHGEEARAYTLQEIADFVGVGKDTIDRIQSRAMRKLKNKMLNLGVK
jgi:DNA-directed RNA polymerase sigma subunit (sigma70/sigma32)